MKCNNIIKSNNSNTLKFKYKLSSNGNIHLITLNKNNIGNGYDHMNILVKNGKGYIKQISKTSKYSGKNMMNLAIKILQKIGINYCELEDNSNFICKVYNYNSETYKDIRLNYKLITLLQYEKTYYMQFGFNPINKNNINLTDFIVERIKIIKECKWENLDKFMSNVKNFINVNRIYSVYYKDAYKQWKLFEKYFRPKFERPFDSFQEFNKDICYLFTIWFDFYIHSSLNIKLYEPFIGQKLIDDCKFNEFYILYNKLLKVKWINHDIFMYTI